MGLSRLSFLVGIFVVIFAVLYGWEHVFGSGDSPSYTVEDKYFGSSIPIPTDVEDSAITSFKIPFERSQVDDVVNRLSRARLSESQISVDNQKVNQSTYGFSQRTAESVREYWMNTFDWKKTVQKLNTFDHYKTRISGLDIHFVRVTSNSPSNNDNKEAILFLHGWPGSFLEYLEVARVLSSSSSSTYDLVIPSLPGFGYSDAAVRPGLNGQQIARIMHVLMQRLGHRSYVVCGGDWGSAIGTHLAQLYPKHVRGLLTTFVIPINSMKSFGRSLLGHYLSSSLVLEQDEKKFLNKPYNAFEYLTFFWFEGGYMHIQATKPDTVGYALNDSPLGLATYILEKWSRWSNDQSEIDRSINSGLDRFTLDQLLSNVMLYWTTGTITSSMRIYHEHLSLPTTENENKLSNGLVPKSVPVAVVNYRHEVNYIPRTIAKMRYPNIKLWLYHDQGGHFAAMETPRQYSRDVENFLLQL